MEQDESFRNPDRTIVHEVLLNPELLHKIRISCHIKVAKIAEIITNLTSLLQRALTLAEEIDRYNEFAFNGKNSGNEDSRKLVGGWIDRWVVLNEEIESVIQGKESIVKKPLNKIIIETVYSACNFNATNRPMEIEIDDDSNLIPIDELKARYDGMEYGLIHASSWAEGLDLKLMIAFFIRRSNSLIGNSDRENGSIYQYIWDGEGGMYNVKGTLCQLIVKCYKGSSYRISQEYQRKIGC